MQGAIIHITVPVIFSFDGWVFEYDRRKPFGPWPLKLDGEPRKRAGKRFYAAFGRFSELSLEEQEKCRV